MPVFIAHNFDGEIESVVLARNQELANAYWQGKGICAPYTSMRSEDNLTNHITGVLPILNTIEKEVHLGVNTIMLRIVAE